MTPGFTFIKSSWVSGTTGWAWFPSMIIEWNPKTGSANTGRPAAWAGLDDQSWAVRAVRDLQDQCAPHELLVSADASEFR